MRLILLIAALAMLGGCSMPAGFIPRRASVTPTPSQPAQAPSTPTTAPALIDIRAGQGSPAQAPTWCKVTDTGGLVLNVRKSPGLQAEIAGALLPGARVEVVGRSGEWLQIQTGELAGFVYSIYCHEEKHNE